jgi:hypothetical protein
MLCLQLFQFLMLVPFFLALFDQQCVSLDRFFQNLLCFSHVVHTVQSTLVAPINAFQFCRLQKEGILFGGMACEKPFGFFLIQNGHGILL